MEHKITKLNGILATVLCDIFIRWWMKCPRRRIDKCRAIITDNGRVITQHNTFSPQNFCRVWHFGSTSISYQIKSWSHIVWCLLRGQHASVVNLTKLNFTIFDIIEYDIAFLNCNHHTLCHSIIVDRQCRSLYDFISQIIYMVISTLCWEICLFLFISETT